MPTPGSVSTRRRTVRGDRRGSEAMLRIITVVAAIVAFAVVHGVLKWCDRLVTGWTGWPDGVVTAAVMAAAVTTWIIYPLLRRE
jgi:hypothetical protein